MLKVIVSGLGNLGKYAIEALESAPGMECVGVLRRKESLGSKPHDLRGVPEFDSIESLENKLGKADVVIICAPSRNVPDEAVKFLEKGYHTVDSFDIHTEIVDLVNKLEPVAKKAGKASIVSAGWDPGTDSIFRAYFEAMAPVGTTFTNFGRGRSMGHSVAARAIKGVKNAASITVPMGGGMHSRIVYAELESGEDVETVQKRMKEDAYFAKDPLMVIATDNVDMTADTSSGVLMERIGGFGSVANQILKFDMRINNPALTAQILVSAARAVMKMPAGAHTMIDIPPVYLLSGDRMALIKRLV